jgi:hypothetical protein
MRVSSQYLNGLNTATAAIKAAMHEEVMKSVSAKAEESIKSGFANTMATMGACPSVESCSAAIDSGVALPMDYSDPSKGISYTAGTPIKDYASAYGQNYSSNFGKPIADDYVQQNGDAYAAQMAPDLVKAEIEKNAQKGALGNSDIEMGLKYGFLQNATTTAALSIGFRLPTGKFSDVEEGKLTTGQGKKTYAIIANFDHELVKGLFLSGSYQWEDDLSEAERFGVKSHDIGHDTFTYVGFTVSPGAYVSLLRSFSYSYGKNFDHYAGVSYKGENGTTSTPSASLVSWTQSVSFDFLQYGVPLQLGASKTEAESGRNMSSAIKKTDVTSMLYWKF